ncbi:TnsA endonuclease N-terminal domain-containing protein [Noviherbaspirillum sp. UKPF54]|uniref:TnsA endonuclease N-terminal domain-containing protein n=1 Tax=Noviherbaspirillum sp. UKPF54 TaxID=2601898 RepID=UPI0011B1BD30|nr:TnsA endonuclease N-terminal domain-containing protein [Noviherbaspirillum sp. UKPF54]QDZ30725.1 hypothetical protein FAY22_20365 [Noviherbaspirillum sp. UKPF54]
MRRFPITIEDIQRWKSQGLGQGEGENYKPWIDVRCFSSKGRSSRAPGITTGRTHHLFSDNEDDFCLMADYAQQVVDIREQFPLLPERATQTIAENLRIRHPRYPNSKTMLVMTTDFLLTIRNRVGDHRLVAYSIKSEEDLNGESRSRVLEKLELERRYWLGRGIQWILITDHDIPATLIRNLDWLNYLVVEIDRSAPQLHARLPAFLRAFRIAWEEGSPLKQILAACADLIGKPDNEALYQLFRHCVWHHLIELDLTHPLGPLHPVRALAIDDVSIRFGNKGACHAG